MTWTRRPQSEGKVSGKEWVRPEGHGRCARQHTWSDRGYDQCVQLQEVRAPSVGAGSEMAGGRSHAPRRTPQAGLGEHADGRRCGLLRFGFAGRRARATAVGQTFNHEPLSGLSRSRPAACGLRLGDRSSRREADLPVGLGGVPDERRCRRQRLHTGRIAVGLQAAFSVGGYRSDGRDHRCLG